jgi:hypothetical protein
MSKFLVDFYFWVIAYIELDTYEEYTDKVELTDEEEKLLKRGLFQHILPCNKEGKRQRILTNLLDRWRDIYSRKILKQPTIITRFEFSHRLPDAIYTEKIPGEMSLDDQQESNYRMFCHWANGDKYPSDEKLKMFIRNLLPPCQERELWYFFAKIAIAMDRYFEKLNKAFLESDLITLFGRYPDYHQRVRQDNIP